MKVSYPYKSVKLVNKDRAGGRDPVNSLADITLNFRISAQIIRKQKLHPETLPMSISSLVLYESSNTLTASPDV